MSKNKITFGLVFGSISLTLDSLSGLLILPLLLKYLAKDIAGLWLLYNTLGALISLAQAGLGPVIMRRAAEISSENNTESNTRLVKTVNISYRLVFLLVIIISLIIYLVYLHGILCSKNYVTEGTIVWLLFSTGQGLRICGMGNFNIINGYGELGWDKVMQIIVTLLFLSAIYPILYWGKSLFALGCLYFVLSIVYWYGSKLMRHRFIKELDNYQNTIKKGSVKSIFKEANSILVLNLVGYLVMNSDMIIIERIFGLEVIPLYSALVKITGLIMAVATLIQQMIYPYVAISWSKRDYREAWQLYKKSIFMSVGVSIVMSIVAYFSAPYVIPIWLGPGTYLGNRTFGLLIAFSLIYIHHCAHANPVIATGKHTFLIPAIINAVLAVPLAVWWGNILGVDGMILGKIIGTVIPSIYVVLWSFRFFNKIKNIGDFIYE